MHWLRHNSFGVNASSLNPDLVLKSVLRIAEVEKAED
jgi:hypothetical protein